MGLDMYLRRKHYVQNWDHNPKEKRFSFLIKQGGKKVDWIDTKKIVYVEEEVAYWRKANAIHKWFVENCADGVDNCQDIYVSRDSLIKLLHLTDLVLKASKLVKGKIKNGMRFENGTEKPIIEDGKFIKDPTVAKELLPTGEGFFFGSTEYNEFYLDDVQYTHDVLTKALETDKGDFIYRASW